MNNIMKKNEEYNVVKKIYQNEKCNIEDSEEPDFIIKTETEKFGVEVTEYYYNESSARLKNYNGYIEKILRNSYDETLDKRDVGMIEKHRLYIKNLETNKYDFLTDMVAIRYNTTYKIGQLPEFKDVEKQIIEIIGRKTKKAEHYNKQLEYLELFINDKENYILYHIKELINSKKILDVVIKSKFKRVYIFSGNYLMIIGTNAEENMDKYN